ncbi:MAG: GNAT family N-acetyltransferase [Myxococcales bacterium]|nr:GNAT family N-acetyltransferase [Myxococcales bacterium]
MTSTHAIAPARADHLDAVAALLAAAALPTGGVAAQFPHDYVVATRDGAVVGAAGLEIHGDAGVLRSVVVDPGERGRGLGQALSADRVAAARARGLAAVYLLTTTAADFYLRLGFAPCARADVPAAVAGSIEFASVCPASAACLRLDLREAPADPLRPFGEVPVSQTGGSDD